MPLIDTLLRTNVEGKALSNQDIEDEVNMFLFAVSRNKFPRNKDNYWAKDI